MALFCKQLGIDLCEVLGLDAKQVRRICFDWRPDRVGIIEVELIVTDAQGHALKELIRRYRYQPMKLPENTSAK